MSRAALLRDRLLAGLLAMGGHVDERHGSKRYTVVIGVPDRPHRFYVGRAGALRYGKTIATSMPVTRLRERLLESH